MGAPRLALIADIHGNLAALEATLAEIAAAGIANGAVAGDLVTRGTRPEECVRRVRGLGWPVVQGNTDRRLASVGRTPDHPKARKPGSRRWSRLRVSNSTVDYLGGLPTTLILELGRWTVLVSHEGPDGPGAPLSPNLDGDEVDALTDHHGVDAIVVAHTHVPQIVRGERGLLVNPGAVGEGTRGERRPSWAWLSAGTTGLKAGLERVPAGLTHLRPN